MKTAIPKAGILSATLLAAMAASSAMASDYEVTVTNLTRGIHFTPLIVAAHSPAVSMFSAGHTASSQLQAMAEGGDTSGLAALLESHSATVANGDGLVVPGGSVKITINGSAGDVLSLAGMLLPTNDGFVGLNSVHLPERGGQVSYNALGYDAGTEANDEVIGSGAPGEAGFPAPPPIVATGTGTGGTGVHTSAEGFVHVHRNVLGDMDANGGHSDINAAVHRWLNPVARVTIKSLGGGDGGGSGVSAVEGLNGVVYSSSALEIFWSPATSSDSYIKSYEVRRNGTPVTTTDGTSFFDHNLNAGVSYRYDVIAMDAAGNTGPASSVKLKTNSN